MFRRLNGKSPVLSAAHSQFKTNMGATYLPVSSFPSMSTGLALAVTGDKNSTTPAKQQPWMIALTVQSNSESGGNPFEYDPITEDSVILRPSLEGEELGVQYPRVIYDQSTQPPHYIMFYEGLGIDASGSVRTTLRMALARNPMVEWGWEKVGPVFPHNSVDSTSDGALLVNPHGAPHYLFYSSLNQNTGINVAKTHNMRDYVQPAHPKPVIEPRLGYFDSHEVTAGTPPLVLHDGNFIMLYNAIDKVTDRRTKSTTYVRSVGWVVLYGKDPTHVLARSKNAIIQPQQQWETCPHQQGGLHDSVMVSGMQALEAQPEAPVDKFHVWYTGCGLYTGVGMLSVRTPEYSAYIVTDEADDAAYDVEVSFA